MLLKEKGEYVSDEKQPASIINKFFINITKSLNLKVNQSGPSVTLENILKKIIFHPGIDKIRETFESTEKFSFQQVTEEQVRQVMLSIDGCKATPVEDIPAVMLNVTLDIHLSVITKIINLSFENGCFPDDLKLAEVSPKFEKIMHRQIDAFMQDELSNLLTGFRKNHSTHHCVGYVCAMFMEISKALDTVHHDLMIAKLCVLQDALQYMRSYLTYI